PGGGGIDAVVVLAVAGAVGGDKPAGHGGRPEHEEFAALLLIGHFRRPGVEHARFVGHYRQGALRGPVHQVLGGGVADVVFVPAGGPDHVVGAVRPARDAGVTHQPRLADRRLEEAG